MAKRSCRTPYRLASAQCLDQIIVFGEAHLRRILSAYAAYYNQTRTHLTLQKDAPSGRSVQRVGRGGSPSLSSAAYITNMLGYDLRKGQGPQSAGTL
jgi:hypothetical protein